MNISALSSTPQSVTNDSQQTLTCTIGNLDQGYPVEVTWTDPENNKVLQSDTTNYSLDQGSVNDGGNQAAQLTILRDKMKTYTSTFTYKCTVMSTQYPESPQSQIDVVALMNTCELIAMFQR